MAKEIEINIEDNIQQENSEKDPAEKKKILQKLLKPLGKLKSPKVLIITGVSLLVLIALVFAGWFFFLKGNNSDKEAVVTASMEQAEKEEIVEKKEPVFMDIIELEPFENIKLKKSGNMGFLAMNISLELVLPVMREEVEADLFRIREVIEQETGKLTWLILRVPQGKLKLKYTLIKSINSLLSEAMISNVYFTRLIMK